MNIAAALMIAGACSEAVLALLWFRFSQASSWRSTRRFAWVALTASGYCLTNIALVVDVSPRARLAFRLAGTVPALRRHGALRAGGAGRPLDRGIHGPPPPARRSLSATVTGFGFLYLRSLVVDARRLEKLSTRLEQEVLERTHELSRTRDELARRSWRRSQGGTVRLLETTAAGTTVAVQLPAARGFDAECARPTPFGVPRLAGPVPDRAVA